MSLYRLDASIRVEGSTSRRLADTVQAAWAERYPAGAVVRREVGLRPLPADAWSLSVSRGWSPTEAHTPEQVGAGALAAELVDELAAAEAYVFAVPLYNYGVPHAFKAWADLVATDPRMSPGRPTLVAGRPAVLAVARGGGYGPGTPREGWDHGTPWMVRMLQDVFGLEVDQVAVELTLADVNPQLAALRPQAAISLRDGLADAEAAGRRLAERARRPQVA